MSSMPAPHGLRWNAGPHRECIARFCRRLGKFDNVLQNWAEEFKAQDEGKRREQTHPERSED
jgi:hypothetical protein